SWAPPPRADGAGRASAMRISGMRRRRGNIGHPLVSARRTVEIDPGMIRGAGIPGEGKPVRSVPEGRDRKARSVTPNRPALRNRPSEAPSLRRRRRLPVELQLDLLAVAE